MAAISRAEAARDPGPRALGFPAGQARKINDALEAQLAQLARQPAPWVFDGFHAIEAIPASAADIAAREQQAARLIRLLPGLQDGREDDAARGRLLRQRELAREQVVAMLNDDRARGERAAQVLDVELDRLSHHWSRREGEVGERTDAVVPPLLRLRFGSPGGKVRARREDRPPQGERRRGHKQNEQHLIGAHYPFSSLDARSSAIWRHLPH